MFMKIPITSKEDILLFVITAIVVLVKTAIAPATALFLSIASIGICTMLLNGEGFIYGLIISIVITFAIALEEKNDRQKILD